MINLDDHLPKRKTISKIVLKSQELNIGDVPEGVVLESIDLPDSPGLLEMETETLGNTKAEEMIKHTTSTVEEESK